MPGKEHETITAKALELLPTWQRERLGAEADKLTREYCHYPDWYFGINDWYHNEAAPYHFETDGIQFHYLPDTPIVPYYRYWIVDQDHNKLKLPPKPVNENWRHASLGFRYYLENAVRTARSGGVKEACSYLGCLLHMLQDYGFGLHSLEGPYGTDIFVLDRLFPEPDSPEQLPSNMVTTPEVDFAFLGDCRPRLLGLTVDEMIFHLYTRHAQATCRVRRICFQIVVNNRHFNGEGNKALAEEMYRNIIALCADVVFTVLSVADNRIEGQIGHLKEVILSDMEPIARPWGLSHYRFLTMLKDKALSKDKAFVPLQVVFNNGGRTERVTYKKGIGMGSHYEACLAYELPKDLYASLTCVLGLFAESWEKGDVTVRILNDGATVFEDRFNRDNPAKEVEILSPGGRWEIHWSGANGMGGTDDHLIWAEPRLVRR